MFTALLNALGMAFAMGWEILWPLVLGFALSAVIQAIVSHREMSCLLTRRQPALDRHRAGAWGRFFVLVCAENLIRVGGVRELAILAAC